MFSRRAFLKSGAVALFGFGAVPSWLARAAEQTGRRKTLVVVFLRGAVDGLNAIVPHGDAHYAALRPTIAIPQSDVLDLDGFYGLHPAMAPLKSIYDARQLAVVHAVGSPDPTRSHFDAQDYMESGTPGVKSTRDGWMNRVLVASTGTSPARAVAMGTTLPRSLRGKNPAVAVADLAKFRANDGAFEQAYAGSSDKQLAAAGREAFQAVSLLQSIASRHRGEGYPPAKLGRSLSQIAQLIKADVGLEVGFAEMGGWDTHVNQPVQLQKLLGDFAESLAAFYRDLGNRMEDVVVVTMSEFGRTARENGNRGTDHGHGNFMLVLGSKVEGGRVLGQWPGLAQEQLYEGRDLAVTTDFRDVIGAVLSRHLGVSDPARIFPGHSVQKPLGLMS